MRKRFKKGKVKYRLPISKPTPISRKFNGLNFGLFDVYSNRSQANGIKETLKRIGVKVRIIKTEKGKHALYSRK